MAGSPTLPKTTIGRSELIGFPDFDLGNVPAKVDTGAYRSAVHVTSIRLDKKTNILYFKLLGGHSAVGSVGKPVVATNFRKTGVVSSTGRRQHRYMVTMRIKLGKRIFEEEVTLAERSKARFPVLLGRTFLSGRFMVDTAESHVDRKRIKKRYGIDFPDDEEGRYENSHTI